MEKKRVSIITPSYNCGKYCDKYFEAILNQTYNNIELIYIVDGSTDETMEKIVEYKQALKDKGIIFKYIYKENGGVSSAINEGLKIFTGEYVAFHDADDYYNPNAIEEMVTFLSSNKEYGLVRFNLQLISENGKKLKKFYNQKDKMHEWILDDIALNKKFAYTGLMYRTKYLKEMIPDLVIDESPCGQNYQLLIPVVSKYKCGYINKVLLNYLVRKNSLSHFDSNASVKKRISKNHATKELLKNELKKIEKLSDYEEKINLLQDRSDFRIYALYNDKKTREVYKKMKKLQNITFFDRIIYILYKMKLLKTVIKIYEKISGERI